MTVLCTGLAIFLLASVGALTIASAMLGGRSARMNAAYREVARQLKTQFYSGSWFRFPKARLRYGDAFGTLSVVRYQGRRCTQFLVEHTSQATEWEATNENCLKGRENNSWVGLEIANPRLARGWRFRGAEPDRVREWLTDGVIWQLERVAAFRQGVGIAIVSRTGRLTLRLESLLGDWRSLAEFLKLGCELYDQLRMGSDAGIAFVESLEATLLETVICPVCGDPIASRLVYCAACKTPHHQECWDYNSRCATFACGERKYCLPRIAVPLHQADLSNPSSAKGS